MRAELTDEAIERVKKTLIDAQSDNPRVRQLAMLEVKKLTVLYGSDALAQIEATLTDEAIGGWDPNISDTSVVWD